ncbi:MAG TPA: flagellar hook-basal body protein [Steroidobacteraceae bacterium]|nr:flagellar hook-basal body protein [Steroidobacteraceae bacterium]
MFDSLYIGATGMVAHESDVDTIANNLANLNTVGFRRGVVSFSEVSAQLAISALDPSGVASAPATVPGAGSVAQTSLSTLAGPLQTTNQPLDLAIDGSGFLEVLRADGTLACSRAGSLQVNPDGMLAIADGTPLSPQIQIPPDAQSIAISPTGQVTALVGSSTTPVLLGRIGLVNFANPAALTIVGNNQYSAPPAAGNPQTGAPGSAGFGLLRQGFLEASNVQMTQEMVSLMLAQRGFELNSKMVQTADQLWSITNGLVRS